MSHGTQMTGSINDTTIGTVALYIAEDRPEGPQDVQLSENVPKPRQNLIQEKKNRDVNLEGRKT